MKPVLFGIAVAASLAVAAVAQTLPATTPTTAPVTGTSAPNRSPDSFAPATESFFDFYAKNLRASLFSGFLTLGSFLVAVNTFIIVNLKKELYDQPSYKAKVKKARKLSTNTSFYGPLRRLSALLLWTIVLAICTAVSQLTIGVFIDNTFGALICLALGAVTIVLLFVVLAQIRLNLRDWFTHWEEDACAEAADENDTNL